MLLVLGKTQPEEKNEDGSQYFLKSPSYLIIYPFGNESRTAIDLLISSFSVTVILGAS